MAVQIICRIVGGAQMRHMLVQNQIAHGKLLRLQFCIRLIPDLLRCCAGERCRDAEIPLQLQMCPVV